MPERRPTTPTYRYALAWALMVGVPVGFWCCRPWLGPRAFNVGLLVALLLSWKVASLLCLPAESWARFTPLRLLAYCVWIGMQPRQFLKGEPTADGAPLPTVRGLILNVLAGAALLWLLPGLLPAATPRAVRLAIALVGLSFLALFARLDFETLIFRALGFAVEKLFDCPVAATTLGEFWGRRWNRVVSGMMREIIFLPLTRRVGARLALLAVFLYSGLYHEFISALARSGYGRPFLYFMIQYLGVSVENSRPVRRLLRDRPWLGRAWTGAVILLPLGLVLPAGFVEGYLVPLLTRAGVPGFPES